MASKKRSKPRRRNKKTTIPLAVIAPAAYIGYRHIKIAQDTSVSASLDHLSAVMTGYSPTQHNFSLNYLKDGLFPILMGGIAHKVAGKLGVNKMIAGAGVPFLRI